MKQIILILCIVLSVINGAAQVSDTIYGKVYSSISQGRPVGTISISEKGDNNIVFADSKGVFKLVPKTNKNVYPLVITADTYEPLEYQYKSEWTQRIRPKSIVLYAPCDKTDASIDWKNKEIKVYVFSGFGPFRKTRQDRRFQRKYRLKFIPFSRELNIECAKKYNDDIFLRLDLTYGFQWREKLRKDAIGFH